MARQPLRVADEVGRAVLAEYEPLGGPDLAQSQRKDQRDQQRHHGDRSGTSGGQQGGVGGDGDRRGHGGEA